MVLFQNQNLNSLAKQVNYLLQNRLVNMKRQCWTNAQYSRREGLDRIGILSEIEADFLEEKVVNIYENLTVISLLTAQKLKTVSKKSTTVIFKFLRRRDCQQVLSVKKDLRKIKMEIVDLSGQNELLINKNLCSYYKYYCQM